MSARTKREALERRLARRESLPEWPLASEVYFRTDRYGRAADILTSAAIIEATSRDLGTGLAQDTWWVVKEGCQILIDSMTDRHRYHSAMMILRNYPRHAAQAYRHHYNWTLLIDADYANAMPDEVDLDERDRQVPRRVRELLDTGAWADVILTSPLFLRLTRDIPQDGLTWEAPDPTPTDLESLANWQREQRRLAQELRLEDELAAIAAES